MTDKLDKLTVETHKKNDEWTLIIRGALDERAIFPKASGSANIRVDMTGISHINSTGIRIWCDWILLQASRPRVFLENSPVIVTKHFGTVRGFVLPNVVVESFFVPFFSDVSGESKIHLYRLGHEFTENGELKHPKVTDSQGNEMQMDVFGNSYFGFLKR